MSLSTMTAMHRGKALAVGAVTALTFCSAALAAENEPPRASNSPLAPSVARPAVTADAPNARLAALIRPPGTIVLNKGVHAVSHPGTGIYCIAPRPSTGIVPSTAVVVVSVEFFNSQLNEAKVQWAQSGSPCPSGRIAVYTFADVNANGLYKFSDLVGFSIYVP